jgi:uncharacterized protein
VIGAKPTIKVHIHCADPDAVQALAARHGTVTRWKREDMAEQHNVLVVDTPEKAVGIATVVAGAGFDRIARELGADVTISVPDGANPSVRDLLVGVNASLAHTVYLLPNDPNVALAAREVGALTGKTVTVVPTADPVAGLAVLLRLGGAETPLPLEELTPVLESVRSASVFFAGKDASVGGVAVQKGAPAASIGKRLLSAPTLDEVIASAAAELGAGAGGLVTLYYGGAQKERDAQKQAALLGERFAGIDVEYYYGGQPAVEYWISVEQ